MRNNVKMYFIRIPCYAAIWDFHKFSKISQSFPHISMPSYLASSGHRQTGLWSPSPVIRDTITVNTKRFISSRKVLKWMKTWHFLSNVFLMQFCLLMECDDPGDDGETWPSASLLRRPTRRQVVIEAPGSSVSSHAMNDTQITNCKKKSHPQNIIIATLKVFMEVRATEVTLKWLCDSMTCHNDSPRSV